MIINVEPFKETCVGATKPQRTQGSDVITTSVIVRVSSSFILQVMILSFATGKEQAWVLNRSLFPLINAKFFERHKGYISMFVCFFLIT